MLSPVLSLKPQNSATSLLFSKISTGSKYLNESNAKQYHSAITHFNLPSPPISWICSRANLLVQRVPLPGVFRPNIARSVQYVHCVMHKCIMVEVEWKRKTLKVCKKNT